MSTHTTLEIRYYKPLRELREGTMPNPNPNSQL